METKNVNKYKIEFYSDDEWNNYKVGCSNERHIMALGLGVPLNCCSKELLQVEYIGKVVYIRRINRKNCS